MKRFLKLAIAAGLTSSALSPVSAAYLIDTGSGISMNGGLALSPVQSLAGYFTLSSNSTITSVEGFIGGFGGAANISIYADANLPTTQLFSSGFYTVPTFSTGSDAWQGVQGLNWSLAAGSYWVAFTSVGTNWMSWQGVPNPLTTYARAHSNGVWANISNSVPVGVRVSGMEVATPGAVPEPATWAMMVFGFGVVGMTMRRRVTPQPQLG